MHLYTDTIYMSCGGSLLSIIASKQCLWLHVFPAGDPAYSHFEDTGAATNSKLMLRMWL